MTPRYIEQRSEPEGPRSRVPRGIQGSASPFHMPSGAQAELQSRHSVRACLNAPQGEHPSTLLRRAELITASLRR